MPEVFTSNQTVSEPKLDLEDQKENIPGHTHNKFFSFCLYPENVNFETKEPEEKIILLLRAHPIVNLKWILISLAMLFVPGIVRFFGMFSTFPVGFELVITLAWYLFVLAYSLESFLGWYFNVYIVTDSRVVDVDFYNLIYKQVSGANLSKIQDVTYSIGGVARTIFNYGDVFIQTAAEVSEFDFLAVPKPDKVAKIIEDLVGKEGRD